MSQQLSIILKSKGKAARGMDGYALAKVITQIDAIAAKLKVERLRSFIVKDPQFYDEMFDGKVPGKLAKKLAKKSRWHACTDGITTFQSLVEYCNAKNDQELNRIFNKANTHTWERVDLDELRTDLADSLKVLRKAQKNGDSFLMDVG